MSTARRSDGGQPEEAGAEQVQEKADRATARGLVGDEVDQTPNEHYTLAGVAAGKPTPETDADAKKAATNG